MRVAYTCRVPAFLLLLIGSYKPLHAATVFGTVTGPDGLVAGAKVFVKPPALDWLETRTDENGAYSMEVPTDFIETMFAEPAQEGSGLIGEHAEGFDISGSRENHLFLAKEVTYIEDPQLVAKILGHVQQHDEQEGGTARGPPELQRDELKLT